MSSQHIVVQERHRLLVYYAMDYIEEHLNEKLTLQKVAELVSYSPFHFHRLFKAVTGENLNDYVKRTRLERSLTKIILHHGQSLSEIAVDCGFSSIGDFSRSFKSYFGRNASEFREGNLQNRKICEIDRKITERYFDTNYYNNSNPDGTVRIEVKRSLKVFVKQLPSYSVIYDRCIGRTDSFSDQERIRQAFERVSIWAKLNPNAIYQSMNIGIPYHFPLRGDQVHWRYDACRTIPANLDDTLGMGSRQLAGGTYGVIQLEKHPNLFDFIMDIFFYEWLPESGFVFDDNRTLLELFSVSDVRNAVYVDCCIPIIKRG
ncbi:helix-turn-helix domain-containing protein [Paenibacillus koleovorans]|uniref:helix-turn-helix domain-containing protein n=1 Tax=Paenibacillus koleovorans TaxID=121608 RepID=UPI0013E32398|nr:helix-turn-helix domain-containing protein [Paenibacillus koleovorans]